jgi:hypothetical protein
VVLVETGQLSISINDYVIVMIDHERKRRDVPD